MHDDVVVEVRDRAAQTSTQATETPAAARSVPCRHFRDRVHSLRLRSFVCDRPSRPCPDALPPADCSPCLPDSGPTASNANGVRPRPIADPRAAFRSTSVCTASIRHSADEYASCTAMIDVQCASVGCLDPRIDEALPAVARHRGPACHQPAMCRPRPGRPSRRRAYAS